MYIYYEIYILRDASHHCKRRNTSYISIGGETINIFRLVLGFLIIILFHITRYFVGHKLWHLIIYFRTDSSRAPSQWETASLCGDVSHWLGANLESALYLFIWYALHQAANLNCASNDNFRKLFCLYPLHCVGWLNSGVIHNTYYTVE